MDVMKVEKISLGTLLKINFIGGFGSGFVLGIFVFVYSLFNTELTLAIGYLPLTGIVAGIGSIVGFPVIFSLLFTLITLPIYLGLFIYLKLRKTIDIKIKKISGWSLFNF